MKKPINLQLLSDELEQSPFFRKQPPTPNTPPRNDRRPDTQTPRPPEPQTPGRLDPQESRVRDPQTPKNLQSTKRHFDITEKAEERQTLRLTQDEFRRLGHISATIGEMLDAKKVDKNDIIRCALHELFEDFARDGKGSAAVLRLRKKYR
jgi:hypothetical protein